LCWFLLSDPEDKPPNFAPRFCARPGTLAFGPGKGKQEDRLVGVSASTSHRQGLGPVRSDRGGGRNGGGAFFFFGVGGRAGPHPSRCVRFTLGGGTGKNGRAKGGPWGHWTWSGVAKFRSVGCVDRHPAKPGTERRRRIHPDRRGLRVVGGGIDAFRFKGGFVVFSRKRARAKGFFVEIQPRENSTLAQIGISRFGMPILPKSARNGIDGSGSNQSGRGCAASQVIK